MKNFEKYEKEIIKQMKIANLLCWLSQKGVPRTIYDVLKWAYEEYDPFTEDEKIILNNLPRQYRWIVRDGDGDLWLFEEKPFKTEIVANYHKRSCTTYELDFSCYNHLFKNVTWEGGAVCFKEDEEDGN